MSTSSCRYERRREYGHKYDNDRECEHVYGYEYENEYEYGLKYDHDRECEHGHGYEPEHEHEYEYEV